MRAEEFMKDLKNSNLDFTKDYKWTWKDDNSSTYL